MSLPKIPNFDKVPGLNEYLRVLSVHLEKELLRRVPTATGQGSLLLVAPNGSVWEVRVNNAGVLSTAQLSG